MSTFNRFRNYRLTNAQHFAFIHAFIQYAQATGFSAQKILAALQALVTVFGTEDSLYMLVKASEIIAQKEEADRRRDSFYSRLHRLVLCWAGSGMAVLDPAASELLKVFQLYKVKVNAQLDEETGQLLNLITDLSMAEILKLAAGEEVLLRGLKGRSGKAFDAWVRLDAEEGFRPTFRFEDDAR